jgi:hypothetical protein
MTAHAPNELSMLWRFTKESRDAHCLMLSHPDGFEVKYFFNGAVLIGMVSADRAHLLERARQWRLRLVADGWVETATDASAVHVDVKTRARVMAGGA